MMLVVPVYARMRMLHVPESQNTNVYMAHAPSHFVHILLFLPSYARTISLKVIRIRSMLFANFVVICAKLPFRGPQTPAAFSAHRKIRNMVKLSKQGKQGKQLYKNKEQTFQRREQEERKRKTLSLLLPLEAQNTGARETRT